MAEVLLIAPSFPPKTGGVEHLMRDIAEHSSHDIDVLTKTAEGFDDKKFGFKVIRKSFPGYIGKLRKSYYIAQKSQNYDKIYLSSSAESWITIPANVLGTDVVSHAHGAELSIKIYRLRTYVRKFLFLLGLRFISEFISISDWTSNKLEQLGVDRHKINQIPNGIDFEKFNNAEPIKHKNKFVLLTVSRLHPRKGHEFVIKAIQDIDCHYIIVGKGDYKEDLMNMAANLGVENKITFTGYVEDDKLPGYYQAADVYVMPSKFMEDTGNVESFGISYIEANAAGLPVIGSKTGGIPTAVRNRYNGLLCEPSEESVKKSILEIKNSPQLQKQLKRNAIEWAKKHDWSNVIKEIDHVLS